MNNEKIALELVEFCAVKKEEALREYEKYNGFSSRIEKTKEDEELNYLQMDIMAKFTQSQVLFWNDEYEKSIENFEKIFNSSDDAKEYAKLNSQ